MDKLRAARKDTNVTIHLDEWKPITLDHIEPDGRPRTFYTKKELVQRCKELKVESSALL